MIYTPKVIDNGESPVPGALCRSIGERVWDLRVEGFDNPEIAAELGIPAHKVSELLAEEHRRQIALCSPEFFRTLNLARSERLIKTYLPLALLESVTVERIRAGQSVDEESIDHPLRCACLVLSLLRFQFELLGLRVQDVPKTDKLGAQGVLSWLKTQEEFIKKAVPQAPSDTFQLPSGQLDPGPVENPAIAPSESGTPEIEFAEIAIQRQDSQTPPREDALSLAEPAAAVDDLDDVRELPFAERQVVAPPDPQAQAEADRVERRRQFLAGEPDWL